MVCGGGDSLSLASFALSLASSPTIMNHVAVNPHIRGQGEIDLEEATQRRHSCYGGHTPPPPRVCLVIHLRDRGMLPPFPPAYSRFIGDTISLDGLPSHFFDLQ